ncbi:MAG: hypothetical protein M3125_08945 [Gemmatimonadota bacterium]|nr:hypothetical protein [Gemmatimonadota bacterium]
MTRTLHKVERGRRISVRRLGSVLMAGLVSLAIAAARAPVPRGLDGMTMCLPLVGPVTRIDTALTGRALRLAAVHERAHAEQCRELGALRSYAARLTVEGKLRSEAVAFCAEAYWDIATGHRREHVLARIADELETAYEWTAGLSRREIIAAVGRECPPLSTLARAGEVR